MNRLIRNLFSTATTRPCMRAKRLGLLVLEDRDVPATFTVDFATDLTANDGKTCLREALLQADANPGPDTIVFAASVAGQTHTLVGFALFVISDVTIDGGAAGVTISGAKLSSVFNVNDGNNTNFATVKFQNLTITNGQTTNSGGAILNTENLTITNCTITGNTAAFGGAITNPGGKLTVTNSTLSDNSATNNSGGIDNFSGGTVTLTNSTVSRNKAASGGGIGNFNGTVIITNTTLTGNTASIAGGGIGIFGGNATLTNTIVAGNLLGTTPDDVNGTLVSTSSNNLIGVNSNLSGITNGTNGNQIGTAATPIDAKLAPLANNGGLTQTHALLPGSPALNAGSNTGLPSQDARGFVRVAGGVVDIGAYETQTVIITPATLPNAGVGKVYNQNLTANFAGQPSGTNYTFTAATPLPAGLSLSPQGLISGTPSAAGNSLISVLATASTGDFVQTNINLTTLANNPPVARDDTASTKQGTAVTIDILANDTDADGDPLTVSLGNAANGTVRLVNGKAIYTPNAQFVGVDFFGYTVTDNRGGSPATARATITVSAATQLPPETAASRENLLGSKEYAVGSGDGGSTATLYNADNTVRFTITPFPGQFGGVRVAVADFDLDGIGDLVVGTGPGGPTEVKVYNGKTQAVMFQISPFEAAFTGGVFVAAGSLSGEFGADLATSPDEGGGPRVRLFGGIGSGDAFQVADFLGIEDPNFRGGARVTMGDINGDGKADLVVAAGFGGGPRIAAFNGVSFFVSPERPEKLFGDFLAFEDTLRNGTFVAVGDVDGDGRAELIAGGGPGGGPRVSVFTGVDLLRNVQTRQADFFAGDTGNRGGVRVAISNLDGDNQADLVTGSGPGLRNRVTNYAGNRLVTGITTSLSSFDVSLGNTGVFVG